MFDGKTTQTPTRLKIFDCNNKSGQVIHYSFNISTQEDQPVKNISMNLGTD